MWREVLTVFSIYFLVIKAQDESPEQFAKTLFEALFDDIFEKRAADLDKCNTLVNRKENNQDDMVKLMEISTNFEASVKEIFLGKISEEEWGNLKPGTAEEEMEYVKKYELVDVFNEKVEGLITELKTYCEKNA